jgi:hypothetical protein
MTKPARQTPGGTTRRVVLTLLLVSIALAGYLLYSREQANLRLEASVSRVEELPYRAYDALRPVMESSNLITLGRSREIPAEFIEALCQKAIHSLQQTPPQQDAYRLARDAIEVSRRMADDLGMDARPYQRRILQAVCDSAPELYARGSWDDWNALDNFLDRLGRGGRISEEIRREFQSGFDRIAAMANRPVALRDSLREAAEHIEASLECMQVALNEPETRWLAPAPAHLDDEVTVKAYRALENAEIALDRFSPRMNNETLPAELEPTRVTIACNLAALRVNHLLNEHVTARRLGTGFIADVTISPGSPSLPGPREMFEEFDRETRAQLAGSDWLIMIAPISPADRQALLLLRLHNTLLINRVATVDDPENEERMRRLSATLSEFPPGTLAGDAVRMIDKHPEAVLVLTRPLRQYAPRTASE